MRAKCLADTAIGADNNNGFINEVALDDWGSLGHLVTHHGKDTFLDHFVISRSGVKENESTGSRGLRGHFIIS